MAAHFPIVFEREDSGVFSAYVAGLPVCAQGATAKQAERAIQRTLTAYLEAHPDTSSGASVKSRDRRIVQVGEEADGGAGECGRSRRKSHQSSEGSEFARQWPSRRAS